MNTNEKTELVRRLQGIEAVAEIIAAEAEKTELHGEFMDALKWIIRDIADDMLEGYKET